MTFDDWWGAYPTQEDYEANAASHDAEIATLYATVQQAHDALQRLWDESNLEPIPYVQEALAATAPIKELSE